MCASLGEDFPNEEESVFSNPAIDTQFSMIEVRTPLAEEKWLFRVLTRALRARFYTKIDEEEAILAVDNFRLAG